MKKWIVVLALLLTGCAAEPVYETIGNGCDGESQVQPGVIQAALPENAALEASEQGRNSYVWGQWEIWTEVREGGDVEKTMEHLTGMSAQRLTLMRRQMGEYECCETVWTTFDGETALVGRAAVLDDGSHHYCLGLVSPEDQAGEAEEAFAQILESLQVIRTEN